MSGTFDWRKADRKGTLLAEDRWFVGVLYREKRRGRHFLSMRKMNAQRKKRVAEESEAGK